MAAAGGAPARGRGGDAMRQQGGGAVTMARAACRGTAPGCRLAAAGVAVIGGATQRPPR